MMQLDQSIHKTRINILESRKRLEDTKHAMSPFEYHTYICLTTVGIFVLSGKIGEKGRKKKSQMSFVFYFFLGGRMKEEKKITQMHIINSKQNQIQNEKNLLCVWVRETQSSPKYAFRCLNGRIQGNQMYIYHLCDAIELHTSKKAREKNQHTIKKKDFFFLPVCVFRFAFIKDL